MMLMGFWLKHLFTALFQVMMIFTLTLAPIPFMDKVSVVYADDAEPDCEDTTNEDGSPGVYRPGCDFNDALTAAKDESPQEGFVGVIEQFIAAAFGLAAISSVSFVQEPMAQIDCPGYMTPNVTLRTMQLGSLAYIVGNIQSNANFKKAAKEAVDIELSPQAKRDENADDETQAEANKDFNSKQLDAYIALVKIYQAKVKALRKKKDMAIAAEVAYLTALGVEAGLTYREAGKCKVATGWDNKNEIDIAAIIKKAEGLAATAAAAEPVASGNGGCAAAVPVIGFKLKVHGDEEIENVASYTSDMTASIASQSKDETFIGNLFANFATVFTLGIGPMFFNPETNEMKKAREVAESAKNSALHKKVFGTSAVATENVSLSCANCAACAPAAAALEGLEAAKAAAPYMCCGTRALEKTADGHTAVVPFPGKIWSTTDVIIPPIAFGVSDLKAKNHTKLIAMDFLQQYMIQVIESKSNLTPQKKVSLYRGMFNQLDYFDKSFDQTLNSSLFKAQLASYQNKFKNVNPYDRLSFQSTIENIKLGLIEEAHADFSSFMGFGVKLMALQWAMGQFMRDTALISPKRRMITYGVMAAVKLGVMKFNEESLGEAEKRRDIVQREAQRFADSHAMRTDLDKRLDDGSQGTLSLSKREDNGNSEFGDGVVACAVPKGDGFAPSVCPSATRPNSFNIPLDTEASRRFNNTPLGSALPLVSDIAYRSASGGAAGGESGTLDGRLGEISNVRNAVRAQADKLVKKFDDDILGAANDKFGLKSAPVSRNNARFRGLFNGDPATNGVTKDQLKNLDDSLGKLKVPEIAALKKKQTIKANNPKFNSTDVTIPNAGDFKFDLGNGGTDGSDLGANAVATGQGEDLGDFQVNAGDIIERPDVSIFKVISNRYLKSYPVLLEEKKEK